MSRLHLSDACLPRVKHESHDYSQLLTSPIYLELSVSVTVSVTARVNQMCPSCEPNVSLSFRVLTLTKCEGHSETCVAHVNQMCPSCEPDVSLTCRVLTLTKCEGHSKTSVTHASLIHVTHMRSGSLRCDTVCIRP